MSAPQTTEPIISIDKLIELVKAGGAVKTGVDIFTASGQLALQGDFLVEDEQVLLRVKTFGVNTLPISVGNGGGIWKKNGQSLNVPTSIPAT